jgi:hypothetical protein
MDATNKIIRTTVINDYGRMNAAENIFLIVNSVTGEI